MKKLVKSIRKSFNLLKASIVYSFHQDTAFIFNNWTNLLSTVFFTISWILLINIIYANTDSVAGYSKDEMLVFALVSQIIFYIAYGLCTPNIQEMITSVNKGSLDVLLTKPVPSLFYVMTRKLNLLGVLRDGLIPLICIASAINYNNLSVSPQSLLAGILILVMGSISTYIVLFIAGMPVFWLGQSEAIFDLVALTGFDAIADIPYEGFSFLPSIQTFFTWILPFLVADAISVSVILQKMPAAQGLGIAVATSIISILLIKYLWKFALKSYSSASS